MITVADHGAGLRPGEAAEVQSPWRVDLVSLSGYTGGRPRPRHLAGGDHPVARRLASSAHRAKALGPGLLVFAPAARRPDSSAAAVAVGADVTEATRRPTAPVVRMMVEDGVGPRLAKTILYPASVLVAGATGRPTVAPDGELAGPVPRSCPCQAMATAASPSDAGTPVTASLRRTDAVVGRPTSLVLMVARLVAGRTAIPGSSAAFDVTRIADQGGTRGARRSDAGRRAGPDRPRSSPPAPGPSRGRHWSSFCAAARRGSPWDAQAGWCRAGCRS